MDALVSFRISPWSFAFIVDDTLYDVMFYQIRTFPFHSVSEIRAIAHYIYRLDCMAL